MNNLLIAYFSFTEPVITGLNSWIASFINLFPSIVLGVVMFTLALKLITFPLDFYSRASMRRNSLKMEQMRPELEKLQKQYADDKQTYQMKMAALYKKEGYSMFGACLPSIITLVFFIIVLNAFNAYSIHQNVTYLYNMNTAFNSVVDDGLLDVEGYIRHENGKVIIDDAAIYEAAKAENGGEIGSEEIVLQTSPALRVKYEFFAELQDGNAGRVTYFTEGGYIGFPKHIRVNESGGYYYVTSTNFTLDAEGFKAAGLVNEAGNTFEVYYNEAKAEDETLTESAAMEKFFLDVQQTRAADKYREEEEGFLWIKNIWMPDTPFQHPVYGKYEDFNQKYKLTDWGAGDPEQYYTLTAKLEKEKGEANGYFILVVLTAGVSFLTQWVMSRGQKAQMELQSVDGQGMMTQKVMMWMMPIMMAVFSFMYTAAFSIYIIMSSLTSLLTTLLINKVVEVRFKKQMEAEANGTAKPKRRAKAKEVSSTGRVKGRASNKTDKDSRIVKKVVLERTEKGIDNKKEDPRENEEE